MHPEHILLCYVAPADDECVLRETAELCGALGAKLSLVVPVIGADASASCCGIRGEHWRRLLDDDTHEAVERGMRLLESLGFAPAHVGIEAGGSLAEIAEQAATRFECDAVAASRKRRLWVSSGLSRRQLKRLHRGTSRSVLELGSRV